MFNTLQKNNNLQGIANESRINKKNCLFNYASLPMLYYLRFTFWIPSTDFQNFLRTQTGNTTTVNIIISTVDYLLRLQVTLSKYICRHVI